MSVPAPSPRQPVVALVGNPNCGKSALFNALTGSRQKVANYAGVTVERKEGRLVTRAGLALRLVDLPGTYALESNTPDERVTTDVLFGRQPGEERPDCVVCVTDATNLRRSLRLALGLRRLGVPMVVALNMSDLARSSGLDIDPAILARELGVPVVETVAVKQQGMDALTDAVDAALAGPAPVPAAPLAAGSDGIEQDHQEAQRLLRLVGADRDPGSAMTERIDRVVLHPVLGPLLLAATLFLVFQAVFAWAEVPMGLIESGTAAVAGWLSGVLPESLLRSLLVDGVVAGVGGVVVFLPQILILFFFILVLEDSGYLPRAAFLLDRLMGGVGLSGRSFIPLLSSFACAIPGIMATRTIQDRRDRLATILIAPLMTCSARLPVYALIIGAFITPRKVWGGLELQGLILFALYVAGVVSAMAVAFVLKRRTLKGRLQPLMLELPAYHWPNLRNLRVGLWQRAGLFLTRVGTTIFALMVLLWFLSTFPSPPPGATEPAILYSFAGRLGTALAVVLEPIGFNWQISIALVPGMVAREVAVGALGTVYALSASGDDVAGVLAPLIRQSWSLPTALSLLAWFVFAPQCLATLVTVKRETGSWRYPLLMAGYLFGLAYLASFVTFRLSTALLGG